MFETYRYIQNRFSVFFRRVAEIRRKSEELTDDSSPPIIQDGIVGTSSVSKSGHLIREAGSFEEMRILHIKSIRGKYKNKLPSSEDFARKKDDEILLEG